MSEYDHHGEERRQPARHAKVHIAKWSPWVWLVPAVAVFIS